MKKMIRRLLILVAMILFVSTIVLADTVAFKTTVAKNDMTVGGDFWLDLEMKITAGTSPRTLNSLTADVYFSSEISYVGADNWAYSFMEGYSRNATDLTTYIRVGTTGNNVNANGDGTPSGWYVTSSWQRVVTLKFTIETATSVSISINDATNDAAYFNNLANNPTGEGVTDWEVINEDPGQVTLPVTLSAFTAKFMNNHTLIEWTTATETDVQGFNIFRSENQDLSEVGDHINVSVITGEGTTTEPHDYSFVDEVANPFKPYYYWLQVVDFDGECHYHGPQKYTPGDIDGDNQIDSYSVNKLFPSKPNPCSQQVSIDYQLKGSVLNQRAEIVIYNIRGQVIRRVQGTQGNATIDVSDLKTGVYFYQLKTDNYQKTRKMIVVK